MSYRLRRGNSGASRTFKAKIGIFNACMDFQELLWQPPKARKSSMRVNIAPPLPLFCPQNRHFGPKGPENPCKHKYANFCLNCSRVAGIPASHRKSGSRNTMVTSDYRPEVEIKQFCACALKYAIQPLFMTESPKFPRLTEMTLSVIMDSAIGQIPRSTEHISSWK